MNREQLVDKFDECFGISTATEVDRKEFFDWVMAQLPAAAQSVQGVTALSECKDCFGVGGFHSYNCPRILANHP